MKNTQREAVFTAVKNVMADKGLPFEEGNNVQTVIVGDVRNAVHEIVCEGFRQGTIEFEPTKSNQEKLASPSKLSAYVSGLISNWLRKDSRLNGDTKYVAKNPGSRAGQGDEQMKTLRALAKQFAGTDKASLIDAQITKRKEELAAGKAKAVELTEEQIAKLPEDVRSALGL